MRDEHDLPWFACDARGEDGGSFIRGGLRIVASWGEGWEHVSVSVIDAARCPTWEQMCEVKRWFWKPDECVVQFHPPESLNVSYHHYCLHLWKPSGTNIVTPPRWMIAPVNGELVS